MRIDFTKKFDDFFTKTNKREVTNLVIHHIEAKNFEIALNLLKEHQVSAHYLIDYSGDIFQLVDDCNIAYHSGLSYWNGCDGLNQSSIGIELVNPSPFKKNFSRKQMKSLMWLIKDLKNKYNILNRNIVGHSDVAYHQETKFLNRKQDPSQLFVWNFLKNNNLSFYQSNATAKYIAEYLKKQPDIVFFALDRTVKGKNNDIKKVDLLDIKIKLHKIGYLVTNFNNVFDEEMLNLSIVFNRRFNRSKFLIKNQNASGYWYYSSQLILEDIYNQLCCNN